MCILPLRVGYTVLLHRSQQKPTMLKHFQRVPIQQTTRTVALWWSLFAVLYAYSSHTIMSIILFYNLGLFSSNKSMACGI